MKYKIPLVVPKGMQLALAQTFANDTYRKWYEANGIYTPHNGVDIGVQGTSDKTYGCACISPFDGYIVKSTFTEPVSVGGNGVTIQSDPFMEDGIQKIHQVVIWHLSGVKPIGRVKKGDIVGYVGNSGLVAPAASPIAPFNGSHIHLMLFEFHIINGQSVLQNADNSTKGAIDPLKYFDMSLYEESEDDVTKDAPAIQWSFDKLGITDNWEKIKHVMRLYGWIK